MNRMCALKVLYKLPRRALYFTRLQYRKMLRMHQKKCLADV